MSFRLELEPEDLHDRDGAAAARRWGMILLVVLMVMAGSAAGLWAAWHVIGQHAASGTVPLLHADERPVKVPPANPGGMEVPDQDMYILNRERPADSRVEQLLPPPETPLPRPVPQEPTITESPPPAPLPQAVPTTPAPAVVAAPPPPPATAASAPPPAAAVAPPPAAAIASPPVAAAAPRAPTPMLAPEAVVTAAAGYRLQLGAVRSAEAAQQEWSRLKRTQADILGGLAADAHRVDLGERGVFYRIVAGPIADSAAAAHACDELKRRKVGCLLVKP